MVDQPEAHVLVFFSPILATKNPYKLLHVMPHLIDTPDICLFQHKQHTQPHLQPHVLSNVWFCHSPHPLIAHEAQEVQLWHMTLPGAPLQLQLLRKEYPDASVGQGREKNGLTMTRFAPCWTHELNAFVIDGSANSIWAGSTIRYPVLSLNIVTNSFNMRLDSFRREPWSTIITPSLSPTPFVCWPNPPFPAAKHPFVGKYLLFFQLLCNFTKLGSTHLGFVPISLIEDLDCPKRKQITIIHSSSKTTYKRESLHETK